MTRFPENRPKFQCPMCGHLTESISGPWVRPSPADAELQSQITQLRRAADRLAYEVASLVRISAISERSAAADALLDYLQVGQPDGPKDVPSWMEQYRKRENASSD